MTISKFEIDRHASNILQIRKASDRRLFLKYIEKWESAEKADQLKEAVARLFKERKMK